MAPQHGCGDSDNVSGRFNRPDGRTALAETVVCYDPPVCSVSVFPSG